MNTKQRTYLVSFRNSDKYLVRFDGTKEELEQSPQFKAIEQKIATYMQQHFATDREIDKLTVPDIEEVEESSRYDGYQTLDLTAVDSLKQSLTREAKNILDQKQMDRNAPFDDIKPY